MKCFFVLPLLLLPVVYGLQCCNIANSNGTGYSNTSTPDLNVTDQLSVCLWVRLLKDEVYDLVSYSDPSGDNVFYISSRQVIFHNHKVADISTYNTNSNKSTHLCVAWHREKGVTTFIDGRKTQDTTELLNFTSKVDFTGSWTAGLQRTEKRHPSAGGLNGSICGLTIWPVEINSDYALGLFNGTSDYTAVIIDTKTDKEEEEEEEEGEEGEETEEEKDGQKEGETEQKVNKTDRYLPAYTWQNFTHHNYSSVNDSFCLKSPRGNGIRLGSLDPVASKFVILFLVIIGVIIGFAGLFMCSEREIAVKRAQKRLKDEENFSIGSTHSVT